MPLHRFMSTSLRVASKLPAEAPPTSIAVKAVVVGGAVASEVVPASAVGANGVIGPLGTS
jgi:hypothetical protein